MKNRFLLITLCVAITLSSCATDSKKKADSAKEVVESEVQTSETAPGNGRPIAKSTDEGLVESKYKGMSAEEIVETLTLEQKAMQMVLPAIYNTSISDMKENCYGSVLSQSEALTYLKWQETVTKFQKAALESEAGVPFIYGQDDVHGVNYCANAVYYPQNIGMGAANDPELMYKIGQATADEAKLCYMLWNYAPCVAQSVDPRWGRTYESYGSDLEIIKNLSVQYTKGLVDSGVVACPKHFFGDGNVKYGTGEKSDVDRLIDRGDAILSDEEIEKLLEIYQAQIDAGAQTIMISHSSLNGLKMHENAKYIQYLKNEMGFEGFIVSDWDSVQKTSGATYKEQVITSVNSGIDMLMEVSDYKEASSIIVQAVLDGEIDEARVNDAVTRILKVKIQMGLMDDPMLHNMKVVQNETGSDEYRALAEQAVEESLVLLKNDNDTLPLKKGTKVYVCGPAADNDRAQCGGWTIDWNCSPDEDIDGVTSILEGLKEKQEEYGITLVDSADEADVVILVVGEQAYAEWNGDTADLELCGSLGLDGNEAAIKEAKESGKPVVTLIVAGRQIIIDKYYDEWDSVVMCYLPGSEGQGVTNVICGESDFRGKLPSPWYSNVNDIESNNYWLPVGYGLTYH